MDKSSNLLQKISKTVKLANHAQTVHDISTELGELDVDLPWRKRPDVKTEQDKRLEELHSKQKGEAAQIEVVEAVEQPNSHLRNIAIGLGIGGLFLIFSKRTKATNRKAYETTMELTKDFRVREYLVSSDIPEIKTYIMSLGELGNVKRNANTLQAGRDAYGKPFFINSGIRPASLTARDGKYKGLSLVQILREKGYSPASFSQHMDGSAADFTVSNRPDLAGIYRWYYTKATQGEFKNVITQMIIYIEDGVPDFIHLGVISDVNKFDISPENRFLIMNIKTVETADGEKKRETKYLAYTDGALNQLLA